MCIKILGFLFIICILWLWTPSEIHAAVSYNCGIKCAICEDGDETRCYRCNESFRHFEKNGSHRICLEKCDYSHQYEEYEGRDLECKECHKGCDSGCNGSSREVRAGGCFKCKLGILEGRKKFCLNVTSLDNACELNGYPEHFVEKVTEENIGWANGICKKCHENCESCIKHGTHPVLHKCVCKHFELMNGSNTYCSENCPEDFEQIPHPQNFSYKRCIRCQTGYYLDKNYGLCVKDNTDKIFIIVVIPGILFLLLIIAGGLVACYKFIDNNSELKKLGHKCSEPISSCTDSNIRLKEPSNQRLLPNHASAMNKLKKEKVQLTMPAIESQNLPICDENSGGFSLVPGGYKQVDYVYLENDDTKQRSSDIIILDNELQRNELLGEGNFSEVYKGLFREKEVAIKVIIADDETKAAIREEYKIMLKTSHPHIHSLLGISMGHVLQLVSELRLGDLKKYLADNISSNQFFPTNRRLYLYCAQIADGMKYLVEQGIVHRDLAARNILVKTIDHVEVSDFGLAKIIGHKKGIRIGGPAPWRWLAIESLTKCEFTYATDVWSYGVTCWEIFHFGIRVPYDDNTIINKCKDERYRKDELLKQLCHGERLRRPEKCDMKTYVELVSCWERNPTDRPTFDDLSTYFHEIELQMKDNEHDYKNVSTTKIHYAEIGPPKTDQHTDHYAIQIEKNYVQKSTTNEETSNQNANCDIQIATNTTICCKKPDRIAMDKIDNDELMAYSEQDNLSPTSIDSGISITSNSSNIEKEQ